MKLGLSSYDDISADTSWRQSVITASHFIVEYETNSGNISGLTQMSLLLDPYFPPSSILYPIYNLTFNGGDVVGSSNIIALLGVTLGPSMIFDTPPAGLDLSLGDILTSAPNGYAHTLNPTNILSVAASGATNLTDMAFMVDLTAGTNITLLDKNGVTLPSPPSVFPLMPGQSFTGTSITGKGVQIP